MKIWIVERYFPYEGTEVMGLFSEEQKANNYVDSQQFPHKFEIYEVEVDYLCK